MGTVTIRYYRVINGRGYWEPSAKMRRHGFQPLSCGPDGPEAWARARDRWTAWERYMAGEDVEAPHYPPGTIGAAWERYRTNPLTWGAKASRTREEWEYAWHFIGPVYGDKHPQSVEVETLSEFREAVRDDAGDHAAFKVIKIWRALWRVMGSFRLVIADQDPSRGFTNPAPAPRSATWTEGEAARLAKQAWRRDYKALAVIIAVAWDTQFSPVDVRMLRRSDLRRDAGGAYFEVSRGKTGKAALGTLSARTVRILEAYFDHLKQRGVELHEDAPIFRNRSCSPYSKDKLAKDFREIRSILGSGETRKLLDMRRSGAVEAVAGSVDPASLSAKMGNSISASRQLQDTYLPKRAVTVRLADEARKRGRTLMRGNES